MLCSPFSFLQLSGWSCSVLPSDYWGSNGLITRELDTGLAMGDADCCKVQVVSAFVQHWTPQGSSLCVATTALTLALALESLE